MKFLIIFKRLFNQLKFKALEQSDKTKEFVKAVKTLMDTGEVKNHAEIIKALDWDKSMFSQVVNGNKNVPNEKYRKFTEVYHITPPSNQFTGADLLRIDAKCDVILSTVAEILANQRGQPVAKVSGDLVSLVNSLVKERLIK